MPEDSADQNLMFGSIAVSDMPESMWQMKPWWCQPWSIVFTGIAVPACSWLLLHRLLITLPVAAVVAGWWLLFLVIVPAQYAAAVKEAKASL